MTRVRLFGPAAEAAGLARDDLPGTTVDEVLAAARARYGDHFAQVAATCKIWVNGTEVDGGGAVADDDEIAVLPPVSGG